VEEDKDKEKEEEEAKKRKKIRRTSLVFNGHRGSLRG
jgi:hypothetical protein